MKGEVHVIYPHQGPEHLAVYHKLPDGYIQEIVGGLIQIVPLMDQFVAFDGRIVTGTAFVNEEAAPLRLPDNIWATALWHYLLRAKGEKRTITVLRGPFVFVSGDEEFMENL